MNENKKSQSCGYSLWIRIVLCFFAVVGSSSLVAAQEQPGQPASSSGSGSQDATPVVLQLPSYSQNIALLGTNQRFLDLEELQTRRRTFFMYGMGASESYEDNGEACAGVAVATCDQLLFSPHLAIINASNHSAFSIQYAPTVVQSVSGPSNHQVFQAGTITFGQPIAPNWVLQLSSSNTYGTDYARLLSPLGFNVNNGVPVTNPSSAVFQFNSGDVLTTWNDVGLSWQRSPSQAMNFSVQESYFSSLDAGTSSSSTWAQVSYSAAASPRTSFNVGANYYHQIFSVGGCNGYGFSIGISHQFSRDINLGVQGGPEFSTAPCNNNGFSGNYEVSLSYPLSRRSRVGLTAGRSYLPNYLSNSIWTDTAGISYTRQLSEAFQISLNSGYARSVLAPSGGTYVGYFAEADLSWKVSRTISLTTSYRRFEQVSGGPNQEQNTAIISLGWNLLPIRIVK
jgi:hypothetical protein